ncbi:replicative helicase loader/inhibitor [Acetobacterium malicum]|uniref:replicative helicase loader/inhibitor n=1 Tax=Acetobacterium malicum TaxID=52692 RepID=UPI00164BEDBB|nr:replicative helicase loader/inhibitor [Acetobacterium malicum]
MTNTETAKILATIAAVYQNFDVNNFKQNIWAELLKETEYQHGVAATTGLLRCCKYPPTPADIIEAAKIEKLLQFEKQEELKIESCRNNQLSVGDAGMLPSD